MESPGRVGRDIVLFLGAGFSWDARMPLMAEFGPESVRTQPGIRANAKTKVAGPLILKGMEAYLAFADLCAASGLLKPSEWSNVEEVFGVAEALGFSGAESVTLDGEVIPIAELIERIQVWIWKTYQQLPVMRGPDRPSAVPNRDPYYELFRTLGRLDLAKRTTIITTNYDIVAEYFAYLTDIPVHYPFAWDSAFGVTASPLHFVTKSGEPEKGPTLCKLHGSVNFFQDSDGSIGVAADIGDGLERVGNTGAGRFKCEPAVVMYDAIWKIETDHPRYRPAIVPPSYAKLRETPWLTATWEAARVALATAQTVIFIGYSLPRSDGFVRALLAGAQVSVGRHSIPRVVVIDTSAEVRREYRRVFHRIEPHGKMGFAKAMQRLLPMILEEIAA